MSIETQKVVKKEVHLSIKDIDYSLINEGPLYVPETLKKPGFVYEFVGDLPGQIQKYKNWGYEVVNDEESAERQDVPSRSSKFGTAYTVQSKCGQTMVLMTIPKVLHEKLMKYRQTKVEEQTRGMKRLEGVSDQYQCGEIKFGK